MRRAIALVLNATCAVLAIGAAVLAQPPAPSWMTEARSGGEATTDVQSRVAFSQHVPGLTTDELSEFAFGNRIFSTSWIEAPGSVALFDGLGPMFSKRTCSGCHIRDGRGRPPEGADVNTMAMVVKLGRTDAQGRAAPDSIYGNQLSELAVQGIAPEGRLVVRWTERTETYPDGKRVRLRSPRYSVADAGYGPLATSTKLSPRIAPAVIGVGLLEAIPDSALAGLEDPDDTNGDGISGRVHWVTPLSGGAGRAAGKFGWKATQASVEGQVTMAMVGDIGITTSARPHVELSGAQHAAAARPTGGEPEIEGRPLASLLAYCRALAVPARRAVKDSTVQLGAQRFVQVGCASCHVPALATGTATPSALSRQTILPFTDLLLHDMGPELSDGMPEGDANAGEWRTPPLWGIGLAERVAGHRFLLHDGRARSVEEAILWHGGEAQRSRDAFRSLPKAARNDLLKFIESL